MMKYGIVYYKDTDNIGDDIQNYAVMQFLPKVDYLIDREDLVNFASEGNEPVAVVLNGWYLHNKFNWPPSKDIYPLCVSMHFSPNDYLNVKYKFLDGIGGEYLSNYAPIGCRDSNTLNVLQEKGIESYLSGCATLTLPRREKKMLDNEYVCVVDVPDSVEQKVEKELAASEIKVKKMTHRVDYKKAPLTWEERIKTVENVLDIYQNAKCVVTKRLHCALPCLAMGTPVLLILDEEKDDVTRYSFFTELLHVVSTKDFVDGNVNYDIKCPTQNKETYIAKRENLINRIRTFITDASNKQCNDAYESWKRKDEKSIVMWRMGLLKEMAQYASEHIDEILREKNNEAARTYAEIQHLSAQYEEDTGVLKKEIDKKNYEITRLDGVITEKSQEERRLNQVIQEKAREEQRLNEVIVEKNAEEQRLNEVIAEKNAEEQRVLNTICEVNKENERIRNIVAAQNEEIEQYKPVYDYIQELEIYSLVWLLFFSEKFKIASLKQKLIYIYEVLKKNRRR